MLGLSGVVVQGVWWEKGRDIRGDDDGL